MPTLPLTRGLCAIVDQADFDFLSQWKWTTLACPTVNYAHRKETHNGRQSLVLMHRLLMAPPAGMVVDHINGDGLDNRRANLRVCTQQQNLMNRRPQRGGTSSRKGVWRDTTAPRKPWRSAIRLDGKLRYLGRFATEDEAADAYARAAKELFGEYHRITHGASV